jgi:hypothetical protein
MAETSAYFESIVAQRAMLLNPDDYQGEHTLSLETQADIVSQSIISYIHDNFGKFMEYLKFLSFEDQELLLSYYLLGKTQWSIARLHGSTQTICSFKLRLAMKRLGTYILMGVPSADKIHGILEQFGSTHFTEKIRYADLIDSYAKTRSFKAVAVQFGVKRPDVRRALSSLSKQLLAAKEAPVLALGAYVFGLIDKASAQGRGLSQREKAKICPIYRRDPALLGQFEVDVTVPDFDHFLVSRANN